MEIKSYKELLVWQEARKLVKVIYENSANFPDSEKFGLTSQIRRAAISIPSNIAEGVGRNHNKDTLQFLFIAKGSLYELETQLYLAMDLHFLSETIVNSLLEQLVYLRKLLIGFIKYKNQSSKNYKPSEPSTQNSAL